MVILKRRGNPILPAWERKAIFEKARDKDGKCEMLCNPKWL